MSLFLVILLPKTRKISFVSGFKFVNLVDDRVPLAKACYFLLGMVESMSLTHFDSV